MTDSAVAELCRLTVRAPSVSVDLAVPADVPVADLLPTLLRYVGEEAEEAGLDHAGWALQRLGDAPLDEETTLARAGLADGDVLYLRPHTETLPEARLDDLVDGIADTAGRRLHTWHPEAARGLLVGATVATVTAALVLVFWPGVAGSGSIRAACAAVVGLLLLAGAGTASRAVGDRLSATALGLLVAPCLALAGWVLPGGDLTGPDAAQVAGARLLAAGAAGAGGAVLALAATAVGAPALLGTAVVSVALAIAGALIGYTDLHVPAAAALVATVFVLAAGAVAPFAFKLAGMRMPALPSSASQLQEGIEPYAGGDVAERTELAGRWVTALFAVTGVIVAGALVVLAEHPNLPEVLTALALSLLLLLHSRGLVHIGQRLTLAVPGIWGLLLLARSWAVDSEGDGRLVVFAVLLGVAAALVIAAWTVPGRRMLPYWGRAAEVAHTGIAVALLPLSLWVAGLFGWLRGLFG
ncbi:MULTISPECIES: type VII secretion integral membrane protein EccD [unclassified Streptomyces]|uniref:type VII secretion integral membrane protein EccD n=1 Tax=unclassified Streptomyces TaxID=2593676 RepID=UPI00074A7414|nr:MULTISPECIES: type VII secretion integral membrane protein EccD [unclassified Streptomyces]KUL71235.1 type VII secretion integral membrane protein EccD [Streptomyces sp. NRRL WC-3604]KUL76850.1 type VII secretion integral membrane protein EccD [Streptomyces sp. NRRL WC-3605]